MKLRSGLIFAGLLALGLSSYSCANGDTASGGGSGGSGSGNGGSTGSGGNTSSGSGGSTSKGGNTGTGGTGAITGSGGSTSKGGNTGTGGSSTTGTGGSSTSGTGGSSTTGTGGSSTTGTGGSAGVSCSASFDPTTGGWVTAPAAGGTCFHGYAYNFSDALGTTITPPTTNTYGTCGTTCSLTAMGMVVIANAANSYSTYAGIGFNLGQDQAGGAGTPPTITPMGSGLTISFTASTGSLQLRAQISDGTSAGTWCYTITGTSPVTIPYSSFNTKCYDTPVDGTAYAKNPISAFQLQVAGGAAAGSYTIALTGVTENN
jgi:hypothetical protein